VAPQAQNAGRGVTPSPGTEEVLRAVAHGLAPFGAGRRADVSRGVVLAVSGGRDSMVLLHAAVRAAPAALRAVATFDHGTGPHATAAAALVRATAHACGVPVVSATSTRSGRTEADWRETRWRFLRDVARDVGAAAVATAHTRDDQLETVALRVLRGAGARGVAALAARSPAVVRPFCTVSRVELAGYAEVADVRWIEDPSNTDRRHARVRVRADLLPAVDRVAPSAAGRLLATAARAAVWRDAVDAWVARGLSREVQEDVQEFDAAAERATTEARLRVAALASYDAEALAVFWPAFAARASVRLDRRAIARLLAWTGRVTGRVRDGTVQPARVPLAGGAVVLTHTGLTLDDADHDWTFIIRSVTPDAPDRPSPGRAIGVAAPAASDYACPLVDPAPTPRP